MTPAPGYWLTLTAGRDIVSGWSADRAERDYLREALGDQFSRSEEYLRSQGWSFGRIEQNVDAALEEKNAEIKRLKQKAAQPGVIVGVGVTHDMEVKAIAGLGWKF